MKVYLVGMPGSGKTTLGRQLADKLGVQFIDLDAQIEQREHHSVSEIFSLKGEDYFRRVEAEILRDFAANNESFVMATGGGAPCFYNGMQTINATGLSVFLDVSVEELARRLSAKTDRPLLKNENSDDLKLKLQAIAEKRHSTYNSASLVVKNPDLATLLRIIQSKR